MTNDNANADHGATLAAIRARKQRFAHLLIEGIYTDAEAAQYAEEAIGDIDTLLAHPAGARRRANAERGSGADAADGRTSGLPE